MKTKTNAILSVLLLISGTLFSAPLSGPYTIGGSSPNYSSFTAAVNDLTSNGVSGPVIFNVRAGVYNEQFVIPAITGASSDNTITFQSQSGVESDVTLEFTNTSSNNYVIELNGASYITIQNLTITSTEPIPYDYGQLIYFQNECDYDNILNNTLIGLPLGSIYTDNTGYNTEAVVIVAIIPSTGLVIQGNTITGGTESIQWLGSLTGGPLMNCSVVKNNIIANAYEWSMAIGYQKNSIMEGNTFTSNSPYFNLGMQIQSQVNPLLVTGNTFTYDNTFTVLYIVNNYPTSLANGTVVTNNFFSLGGGCSAIEMINNNYTSIYNNSIYGNGSNAAIIDYGGSANSVIEDNIIYETGGAPTLNLSSGSVSTCDYNDLYSTGSLGTWSSTNESNLAAWQSASGFDGHSKSLVPPFTSFNNLHLTNYTTMRFGIPIAAVPDDFDGYLRGASPTVGADDTGTIPYSPSHACCGCTQPAFSASATSICQGSTIIFTDESGDSPTGWQWTFAGGTPDNSDLQNPTVAYDTAGTFTVKLVVTLSTGTDSLIKTGYITVNASPSTGVLTLSKGTVCAGDSSQLTVTGSAGTIQWQSAVTPGAFSSITGADDSIYSTGPLFQTTDYRWVVSQGSCVDTSTAVSITVNQLPTPPVVSTADSLICANDSTNITSSGSYSFYLWNNGDTTSYTWVNSAGGYWVTVTDTSGCSAISDHQDVAVYPVPSVSIVVQGDTLSSFGAISYQWYLNDDSIPGANNPVYIASQPGNYSVGITDTNGCKAVSNNTYVAIAGLSQPVGDGLLTIYPDPFNNTIFIKENEAGAAVQSIKIYDVLGRMMLNNEYYNSAPLILPVDVTALTPGAYYIKIETNQAGYIRSIIKD